MKKVIVILVVLVIIAGGVVLLTRNKSDKDATGSSSSTSQTGTLTPEESNKSEAPAAAVVNTVKIVDMAFSPQNITVKRGTKVTWTNNDTVAHDVTETDSKDGPKSGTLNTGESYSFTFDTVGTFKYHCSIHPSMTGTVTVTE